jgi:alpha/beta superfamily hydrolase
MAAESPAEPIVLVAWSFGADMALQVIDPRVAGWVLIAPPLRFRSSFPAASDARPKHLILAEHDEYRAPTEIRHEVAAWANTTTAVVAGASHFFVGRTDRVTTETQVGIDRAVG